MDPLSLLTIDDALQPRLREHLTQSVDFSRQENYDAFDAFMKVGNHWLRSRWHNEGIHSGNSLVDHDFKAECCLEEQTRILEVLFSRRIESDDRRDAFLRIA